MRLLHAITAGDLRDNGMNYSGIPVNTWTRIAKTPLYIYGTTINIATDTAGLRFRGGYYHFCIPVGQNIRSWKDNEVLGCGYYIKPYSSSLNDLLRNHASQAMYLSSKNGNEAICLWSEIYPFTDEGNASFIEFRVSRDLKTGWVMVNGKLAKTVTLSVNVTHDIGSLMMYLHAAPGVGYSYSVLSNLYVAFFDPAVERPYLGRWNCEALTISASEFPGAADDGGTLDVLGVDPKSIEFTYAGVAKPKAVVVSAYGWGDMPEVLEAKIKSGANESTLITTGAPDGSGTSDSIVGSNLAYGMLIGCADFDNASKKVTATLKLNK